MKLGIVLSTEPTRFSALSPAGALERSMRCFARMGYDGVELAVRNPDRQDGGEIRRLVMAAGLEVPAIGTGQAFLEEGLSFTDARKSIRSAAVSRVKAHIRLADRLGAGVIIGLIRGRGLGPDGDTESYLHEAMAACAACARRSGVDLYIEPINRYETSLINTVDEAIRWIQTLRCSNLKLLADTFHMNIEEPSVGGSLARAMPFLGHVHVADSNRRPPGCGHLNFREIIGILEGLGYDRFVSMEMEPWPTPHEAARRGLACIRPLLKNTKGRSDHETSTARAPRQ